MARAAVDGAELYCEEVGAGPPCLVMHGGPGVDHTCFRPWLDRLGDVLRLMAELRHLRDYCSSRCPAG